MALVAANVGIVAMWFAGIATASSPTSPFFWFSTGVIVYWSERGWRRRAELSRAVAPRVGVRPAV
jgi:hypothetical protein